MCTAWLAHNVGPWASCQISKIAGCACAGNAGNVFPPSRVSNPDMHHDTCVTHLPRCMSGSRTNGFLWSVWRGKRPRHSRRMRNPQFYLSGKRPMGPHCVPVMQHVMVVTILQTAFSNAFSSTEKLYIWICREILRVPNLARSRQPYWITSFDP